MKSRGRYMGVTAYVGMPGSGKTYALAQRAAQALARGDRVVSNAGFEVVGSEVLATFDDFVALGVESVARCCRRDDVRRSEFPELCPHGSKWQPITIVWDELPLYFNARKWAEFPDAMMYRFTQVRKDGLRLFYSSIHENMIDVNIRRVTFWYWHCRAVTGRLLRRSLFPPEEFRKAKARPYAHEWVWVREAVAASYDTDAKVAIPEKLRRAVGEKAPDGSAAWVGATRRGAPEGGTPGVPGAVPGVVLDPVEQAAAVALGGGASAP